VQSHIQELLAVNASRYKYSLGTINTQQFLTTHDVFVFIKHIRYSAVYETKTLREIQTQGQRDRW